MSDSMSNHLHLILVSQSPRRIRFLNKWGFEFFTCPVKISEKLSKNMSLDLAIQDIARRKSKALKDSGYLKNRHNYLLLSADTLVVLQNCTLGKPRSKKEAIDFLQRLSGSIHAVKTGLCLWDHLNRVVTGIETTKVHFKPLSLEEIVSYVKTGDCLDKAGAYGIQSVKDSFIDRIEGSMNNMMGLSRNLLEKLLKENNWNVKRKFSS